MVHANLKSLFVVDFMSKATLIATTWFTFMTEFTHTTAEHTKMRRSITASTTARELVQKHHVRHNQHFDEDVLISLAINDYVFLLFNFHE
jgi:hypothetical protein